MGEGEVCIVCGRRPDSFYVRVDSRAKQGCVFCSLFGVDVERLFGGFPDAAGIVCLSCLLPYMQRDTSPLASPC